MDRYLLRSWFCWGGVLIVLYGCESPPPPAGEPLRGLSAHELERFREGRRGFERIFTPEEGLGPLFNAAGCVVCHLHPATGGGSAMTELHATAVRGADGCDPLLQEGGPVIQQRATPLLRALGIEREGIPPGASSTGVRSSPPVFGLGLVDLVPEETILARADPDDRDGDGISGRPNRFIDGRMGRFGRKAFLPTLLEFNSGAFPIEQGVTTPRSPAEETLNGMPLPASTDPAADPEVSQEEIELVHDFVRFLAPPARAVAGDRYERALVRRGEKVFADVGCATCHVPAMKTGPSPVRALHERTVALYSDLLLHDMGSELADVCLGVAGPSEFRTEMLMGLRFRTQFLHDGSAASVPEAIERHGGEAVKSREAFRALDDHDRAALLRFLQSL